jgi:arsenate reductase-like glutaredoxin family protein
MTANATDSQHKTLDIITLFHKAGSPASTRVANLLKQVSANSTAGATIDQASDHSHQTTPKREQFELNITEDPPTADQVQTILEYVGKSGIPSIIRGARDEKDALKKFKESKESLQRPLVCVPLRRHGPRATCQMRALTQLNSGRRLE